MHVNTQGELATKDITSKVNDNVTVENGVCTVSTQHTTCGLVVNENTDGSVPRDLHDVLSRLAPKHDSYEHDQVDGNAHAHIRSSLLNASITVPVKNNELRLGTWQRILLLEFDGPRQRTVSVTCTPGEP